MADAPFGARSRLLLLQEPCGSGWSFRIDEAEKGFRRIQGYGDLKHLKAALARPPVASSEASASPPVACAPSVFADASEDL